MIERICKYCGKKQMVSPAYANRPFCGRKCMSLWMSENQKGQSHWNWQGGKWKRYCIVCGKEFYFDKGDLKRRNISRIFCSVSCKAIYQHKGKGNPNWRGGIQPINLKIRNSKEAKEWKRKCIERDEHKCQKCGEIEGLHIHHIKSFEEYPDLRFVLENGITLCNGCHYELHSKLQR